MNISSISPLVSPIVANNRSQVQSPTKRNDMLEEKISNSSNSVSSNDEILDLYHQITSRFENASFRICDTSGNSPQDLYGNSMHEVGSNFGNNGKPSIEFDVSFLKHMAEDPQFKEYMDVYIGQILDEFHSLIAEHNITYPNNSITLAYEDDSIQFSIVSSPTPFSSEAELRAMGAFDENRLAEYALNDVSKVKNDLLEQFMEQITKKQAAQS